MTVPALGCPRFSRWDLTRHGLSSLPYSPDTGDQEGKGATRGGESLAVFHSNIGQDNCGLPSLLKHPTVFYRTAQEIVAICVV